MSVDMRDSLTGFCRVAALATPVVLGGCTVDPVPKTISQIARDDQIMLQVEQVCFEGNLSRRDGVFGGRLERDPIDIWISDDIRRFLVVPDKIGINLEVQDAVGLVALGLQDEHSAVFQLLFTYERFPPHDCWTLLTGDKSTVRLAARQGDELNDPELASANRILDELLRQRELDCGTTEPVPLPEIGRLATHCTDVAISGYTGGATVLSPSEVAASRAFRIALQVGDDLAVYTFLEGLVDVTVIAGRR